MSRVILYLLDSAQGHPLQTWTFEGRDSVTLGRSEDNDVVVTDPYVSRSHAYLKLENNRWTLTSISQQRISYQGELWNELPLKEGTVFRLGQNGCHLRFGDVHEQPKNLSTISFDPQTMPVFQLDRDKMEQEVGQISSGQFFKQLQDTARSMREQRLTEETRVPG
jgi:hypothetical protein